MLGVETVILVTPPGKDAYGDPLPGTGTERELTGCQVYPEHTGEATFGAQTTTGRYVALLPIARTEVTAQMQAKWDGETWNIRGTGLTWRHYDGDLAATQIVLTKEAG